MLESALRASPASHVPRIVDEPQAGAGLRAAEDRESGDASLCGSRGARGQGRDELVVLAVVQRVPHWIPTAPNCDPAGVRMHGHAREIDLDAHARSPRETEEVPSEPVADVHHPRGAEREERAARVESRSDPQVATEPTA